LLTFYSLLYELINELKNKNPQNQHYILLLDEGDLTFHPEWKRRYIYILTHTLPYFFAELPGKPSFQIIFTTHDPLTLSDMPNNNVVYLKRNETTDNENGFILKVLQGEERPQRTFAANITDLLAGSFFLNDGLIGEFAKMKINEIIDWFDKIGDCKNCNRLPVNKNDPEKYRKLIEMIDELLVRKKLAQMYDDLLIRKYLYRLRRRQDLEREGLNEIDDLNWNITKLKQKIKDLKKELKWFEFLLKELEDEEKQLSKTFFEKKVIKSHIVKIIENIEKAEQKLKDLRKDKNK